MPHAIKPRQMFAAHCLLLGWSQVRVAREIGVSPRTVQRWLKKPAFRSLVETEVHGKDQKRVSGKRTTNSGNFLEFIEELLQSSTR